MKTKSILRHASLLAFGGRQGERFTRGDMDRDGIRNSMDSDRDGDGIANRSDPNPNRTAVAPWRHGP